MKTIIPSNRIIGVYHIGNAFVKIPNRKIIDISSSAPGPWIASTWLRDPATGLWTNAPVPVTEYLTNGTFADWTGDNPNSWTVASEDANNYVTENPAGAMNIVSNNTSGVSCIQTTATPIGSWIKLEFDLTITTLGARLYPVNVSGMVAENIITPGTIVRTGRALANPSQAAAFVRHNGGASNFSIGTASVMSLPLSQLLAYRNYGRQVSIASAFTLITGIRGGVVSRLSVNPDGTFNFVHCWHDGTNLHLDTVINSYTVVSKVNAAADYGAGRIVKINFSAANTAQAFYNGTQIGADADISAVPAGTMAGLFLTGAGSLADPVIT